MMIKGTTKNLGVMGWPIAHSLSPVLQNAAIAAADLDYTYMALPVKPEALAAAVNGLKDGEGEELHLLMVDNHIPAGAKLY